MINTKETTFIPSKTNMKSKHIIEGVVNSSERVITIFAAICLFLMMLLVTSNAVGRYLFNTPIGGSYEIVEWYLMPIVVLFTFSYIQGKEGNIKVGLIYKRLPNSIQNQIDIVGRMLTLIIFIAISYVAGNQALEGYSDGFQSIGTIQLPVYISWVIVFIGLLMFCMRLALQLVDDLRGGE